MNCSLSPLKKSIFLTEVWRSIAKLSFVLLEMTFEATISKFHENAFVFNTNTCTIQAH